MQNYYWLIILTACGLIAGVLIWWLKAIKNTGEVEYDYSDGRGYYPEDYSDLLGELNETKVRYDAQVSCNKPLADENARLKERVFILENEKNNVIAARKSLEEKNAKLSNENENLKWDLEDAIAQRNKAEELLKAFNSTYDSKKEKIEQLNRKLANDYTNNNGRLDKRMEAATERRAENCP